MVESIQEEEEKKLGAAINLKRGFVRAITKTGNNLVEFMAISEKAVETCGVEIGEKRSSDVICEAMDSSRPGSKNHAELRAMVVEVMLDGLKLINNIVFHKTEDSLDIKARILELEADVIRIAKKEKDEQIASQVQ